MNKRDEYIKRYEKLKEEGLTADNKLERELIEKWLIIHDKKLFAIRKDLKQDAWGSLIDCYERREREWQGFQRKAKVLAVVGGVSSSPFLFLLRQ